VIDGYQAGILDLDDTDGMVLAGAMNNR